MNYQHLPLKFNCSILPAPTSSFPLRNLTHLFAYLEKLLQISSFCQPSLELLALHRGRESGTLYWKQWEELKITRCLFSIQHSDKLMTFIQDYFFLVWGELLILFWMGKCEFFPYPVAIFEAKKAGNIGTFHLARALKEVKYPQPQNENSCSSCPRQGPQRTYRLHLFCQLQDNLGVLSLTLLSYPVINLLT